MLLQKQNMLGIFVLQLYPKPKTGMQSDKPIKVAILDDYQGVALQLADWTVLKGKADITVFRDHLSDLAALVERLKSFDVVCVMRERTPFSRSILEQLPNLKLLASTAPHVPAISREFSVVESLSSLILALDPLLLLPTFRLFLGFKKSSFPSPLFSGIAEIHSFAMIDDLLDPRPRFPLFRFLMRPGVHS
jgi:hypothetical protein